MTGGIRQHLGALDAVHGHPLSTRLGAVRVPAALAAGVFVMSAMAAAVHEPEARAAVDDAAADTGGAAVATGPSVVARAPSTTVATTTSTTVPAPIRAASVAIDSGRPTVPDDPVGLADVIGSAERTIRDPATTPGVAAAQGHVALAAYRVLREHPDWHDQVLGAVPDDLRQVVGWNLGAGQELRSMIRQPATELPPWRIRAPKPADELLGLYRAAADAFGLEWQYLAAIHLVETRMGRIEGLSVAGAQGPMQFMPATWAAYGAGGDITDDADAIMAAARYLAASGAPTDYGGALWAYNHSEAYVRAVATYARVMIDDPRALYGYVGWEVYYFWTGGDSLLPVGWIHPDAP